MENWNEQKPRDVDLMWPMVKNFYERMYRSQGFVFERRPPDNRIKWLYEQMQKLGRSLSNHKPPPDLKIVD